MGVSHASGVPRLDAARLRRRRPAWSGWAWGAIALAVAFVVLTCWWLSQDRAVPAGDAGAHLFTTVKYRDLLTAGRLSDLWTESGVYPPTTFLVGALAMLVGGLNVAAPVVGHNLVYVPLLALGCYQTGRLVRGPQAGFLAVVLALGSPLLIEQFHVVMLDAPVAALIAVAVWLILASERFSRMGFSVLAGLAVGIGIASKENAPVYLVGLLAVVLLRERGWRNWRGLAAFAGVALVVAAPWYVVNASDLHGYAALSTGATRLVPEGSKPSLLSLANLTWYLWATLNALLLAPLFAFVAIGVVRTAASARRLLATAPADVRPELLGGLVGAWLVITLTPHHDMRYTMPLIVYLAVLGTAWIVDLSRARRMLATTLLWLAVIATTLGATFGVGGHVRLSPHGDPVSTSFGTPPLDQIALYSDRVFRLSGPQRDGDVLAFFRAMRREGVADVGWVFEQAPFADPAFDTQGLLLFAYFAGLWSTVEGNDPRHVQLIRARSRGDSTPCLRLGDGTGVWALRGGSRPYCPTGWRAPG